MRRKLARLSAGLLLAAAVTVAPGTAWASDHLADAATSAGADERGFANPVAGNPSGTAGAASGPGTVPGEGNPSSGADTTTPAVDLDLVCARSGGHGGC